MASAASAVESRPRFGMTDAELAARPTVFRDGLLAGQVALVSGGGSGMGKAMAFLFARLGAQVVICGRKPDRLAGVKQAIARLVGAEIMTHAMTIREPEAVEAMLADTFDRFGKLDCLVNNAGGQFAQDAIDFSRKGWLAVVDTNLNGTWWMMQEAARRWIANGQPGNLINIVAHTDRGMPQAAHTCAARAGIIALTRTVAVEWAPHRIRVNCVAPGTIETDGFEVYPPDALRRFHEANPMMTLGDAWDVAEGVVYLAAPTGKFITGETLTIDGGMQNWGVVWPAGMPDYFKVTGGA
jgi:NAD(P)-dependent dehydrogenase (short-subunit alcohol dehydrogenase family)